MHHFYLEFVGRALWICILHGASVNGQHIIDISVNGKDVIKTNTNTYTIFNPSRHVIRTITISCISTVPVSSKISIFRDGVALNDIALGSQHTENIAATKFTYRKDNVENITGVYSCRFYYSNNSVVEYSIVREVVISVTSEQLCASSNGFLGYVGEKATLLCKNTEPDVLKSTFFQALSFELIYLHVNILKNKTFTCKIKDGEITLCSKNLIVYPTLEVDVSPNNFTLSSQVLNFTCESTPPRLLHWVVVGDDGNFLDLTSSGYLHEMRGVNININQEAGRSFLLLSSSVNIEKTNVSIHRVECYVDGTRMHDVSYGYIEQNNKTFTTQTTPTTNGYLCTCPSQTNDTPCPTNYGAERTSNSNVTTNGSIPDQENHAFTENCKNCRQSCQNISTNKDKEINNCMIRELCLLTTASIEALILLFILCIWIYRKCRTEDKKFLPQDDFSRNIISPGIGIPLSHREPTDNIISPETKLHTNPVYQSYD